MLQVGPIRLIVLMQGTLELGRSPPHQIVLLHGCGGERFACLCLLQSNSDYVTYVDRRGVDRHHTHRARERIEKR